MAALLAAGLFSLLMVAITAYGYRRYARPGRYFEQLGDTVVADPLVGPTTVPGPEEAVVRVITQIGEAVPVSPQDVSESRRMLIAAGYRTDRAVYMYYGIKVVLSVLFVLLALVARNYLIFNPVLRIVVLFAAGGLGWFGPSLVLDWLVGRRQERIRLSLPDALDLMVVSVEAGLALDQAIQHVSRELRISHPEISEEFGLMTLEMRAGKRRAEALRNLADRTGERELRKLVAVLVQTDRFGTSMADSLRTHSDFMRVRRRQEAEERAGKVGVKLVFPIFFCILPAMLVVAAGPGILQVVKYLFPIMRSFNGM